jgi:hypothetical protein
MNLMFSSTKILAVVAVAVVAWGLASSADAQIVRHSVAGDLFYNEYVPPCPCGGVGAQLYPCPRPAPPVVGYTYITYQPLMPQEFLYKHHRVYKTAHEDAPPTRTTVRWSPSFVLARDTFHRTLSPVVTETTLKAHIRR